MPSARRARSAVLPTPDKLAELEAQEAEEDRVWVAERHNELRASEVLERVRATAQPLSACVEGLDALKALLTDLAALREAVAASHGADSDLHASLTCGEVIVVARTMLTKVWIGLGELEREAMAQSTPRRQARVDALVAAGRDAQAFVAACAGTRHVHASAVRNLQYYAQKIAELEAKTVPAMRSWEDPT